MWSDEQRSLLDQILDTLIPASADGRVPGAGASGVAGLLPLASAYHPEPGAAIGMVLETLEERAGYFALADQPGREAMLRDVEAENADAFAELVRQAYMAYYSRPEVRPHFGVARHPVHPEGYEVERESPEILSELTAPVTARGPVYRNG